MFIPKHTWHKEKQRFLSLGELFKTELAGADQSHLYDETGIELICNTPDKILDLAVKVNGRLKGQWQLQPEDEALQQRFWEIFRQYIPPDRLGNIQARSGVAFLRKYKDLLN